MQHIYVAMQKRFAVGREGKEYAMRDIRRPIHCGYETLRLRRDPMQREVQFNRKPFPANEQITALGFAAARRPQGFWGAGTSR